jgi:hypothetical protein
VKTVCPGWSRPHITAILLADDGKPDGQVSYGMCLECQREYGSSLNERELIAIMRGRKD